MLKEKLFRYPRFGLFGRPYYPLISPDIEIFYIQHQYPARGFTHYLGVLDYISYVPGASRFLRYFLEVNSQSVSTLGSYTEGCLK